MDLEEAINTAIEYETRVMKVYDEALTKSTDDIGKRIFKVLAAEEKRHLEYLNSRLEEWENTGEIIIEDLETYIPSKLKIDEEANKLKLKLQPKESDKKFRDTQLKMLKKALEVEEDTSNFYKKMVSELSSTGQELFMRFVEIEEGHKAIVQAEIDSVTGIGYWFDMPEFNLSGI
jgi:rubrerythrin